MSTNRDSSTGPFHTPSFADLCIGLVLGALFVGFSFPIGLTKLAHATGWPVFGGFGNFTRSELIRAFGASSITRSVSFNNIWSLCLLGLVCYLVALALLSLRHMRLDVFVFGVGCLALGIASLHIIAWSIWLIGQALYIIGVVLYFLYKVISGILLWGFHGLGRIFGFIKVLIEHVIGFFIKSGLWPLVFIVVGAIIIFLVIKYFNSLKYFFIIVGVIGMILGVLFLLYHFLWPLLKLIGAFFGRILQAIEGFLSKILKPISVFFGRILLTIGEFLGKIFKPTLVVLLIGYILYGLGAFMMDQFRGAWNSGNGRRGVILGSSSVGTTVALVLMETNLYHVTTFYPNYFSEFSSQYLHDSLPIIDITLCLLVLGISILGIIRNLPRFQKEPEWGELRIGFVMLVIGVTIGILVAIIAVAFNQDNN